MLWKSQPDALLGMFCVPSGNLSEQVWESESVVWDVVSTTEWVGPGLGQQTQCCQLLKEMLF